MTLFTSQPVAHMYFHALLLKAVQLYEYARGCRFPQLVVLSLSKKQGKRSKSCILAAHFFSYPNSCFPGNSTRDAAAMVRVCVFEANLR